MAVRGIEGDSSAAQFGDHLPARAPNEGAKPRQHFFHPERLRDVIIRSAVDPLDLLVPAPSRGQDEDRHRDPGFAPSAQQRQAIDHREPEIQEDGVVSFGLHEEVGAIPLRGAIDRVAGAGQRRLYLARQSRLVFHHEDPHGRSYTAPTPEQRLNAAFTIRSY